MRRTAPREREDLLGELAERLKRIEADPDDPHPIRALSSIYTRLARLDAADEPASAREWLEKDVVLRERVYELEPGEALAEADLATGLWRLARSLERDDPRRARALLVRALEIREDLAARVPGDRRRRQMVAVVSGTLGRLDARTDPTRGRTWLLRALALREEASAEYPADVDALHDLAFAHLALARAEDTLFASLAARSYEKWHAALDECVALRPDDESYAFDRALAALDFAEALERAPNGEAESAMHRAADLWRDLAARRRRDPCVHEGLSRAWHTLARFLHRAGRSPEARALLSARDRSFARAVRLGAKGAWFELFRARVLASRGEVEAALEALERAVDLGLEDGEELLREADLEPLRSSPAFRLILGKALRPSPEPRA